MKPSERPHRRAKRCRECHSLIDPQRLAKDGKRRTRKFCSNACKFAWFCEHGHYEKLARSGNAAQARYKEEHGKAPGQRGGARQTWVTHKHPIQH